MCVCSTACVQKTRDSLGGCILSFHFHGFQGFGSVVRPLRPMLDLWGNLSRTKTDSVYVQNKVHCAYIYSLLFLNWVYGLHSKIYLLHKKHTFSKADCLPCNTIIKIFSLKKCAILHENFLNPYILTFYYILLNTYYKKCIFFTWQSKYKLELPCDSHAQTFSLNKKFECRPA